jgi:hypothetical protein
MSTKEHRLKTWENRVFKGERLAGKEAVIFLCDGQSINQRITDVTSSVGERVLPTFVSAKIGSEIAVGGGKVLNCTVRGCESAESYAYRVDWSHTTAPFRRLLGNNSVLFQLVLDGKSSNYFETIRFAFVKINAFVHMRD